LHLLGDSLNLWTDAGDHPARVLLAAPSDVTEKLSIVERLIED